MFFSIFKYLHSCVALEARITHSAFIVIMLQSHLSPDDFICINRTSSGHHFNPGLFLLRDDGNVAMKAERPDFIS